MWVGKADFLSISEDVLSIYSTLFCFPSRNWLQDHYHLVGRQKGQAGTLVSFDFELLWLWALFFVTGERGSWSCEWDAAPRCGERRAAPARWWGLLAPRTRVLFWQIRPSPFLSSTSSLLSFAGLVQCGAFSVIPDCVPVQISVTRGMVVFWK